MKYLNQFDEFLNEELKSVNNEVSHYTNDIIYEIQKIGFENDINKRIRLDNRYGLKLDISLIVKINPDNFNNYGYFRKTIQSKIEGDILTNCILYLELNLTESEIKSGTISNYNKIRRLINHELNHALEIYQYEYNNKRYRNSWELAKKQQKHRIFSKNWKYWDDFIHLIYLGLNHEMSSRVSSIYEELIFTDNPREEMIKTKTYIEAKFMSEFTMNKLYDLFIKKYSEKDFLIVFERFCDDFEYSFKNDLNYCKNLLNRIIKSLNKKGKKIIKKIDNVVKRIEQEKMGIQNEGYFEKDIDYGLYK